MRNPLVPALMLGLCLAGAARASDHLDSPTVIADPASDIGDLYAWLSPDGRRLNAVIDIVGKQFSDRLLYVLHVDSGSRPGATTVSTDVICGFDAKQGIECWAGAIDHLHGQADDVRGITGEQGKLRVFAGLRDDPFFNNVRGTRAALNVAHEALSSRPIAPDARGFFAFDADTLERIAEEWRHTEGGPARNFLAGWSTGALVISVDVDAVDDGGSLLAVWSGTYRYANGAARDAGKPKLGERVDRMGRALTGNALLGPLDEEAKVNARKEQYNRAARAQWPDFVPDIARNLALYDSFDGVAGNQWRYDAKAAPKDTYRALAELLVDDRLWIDSRAKRCEHYLAVELSDPNTHADCGGRTPNYNADAVFRSLLIRGTTDVVDDGVSVDDAVHSISEFPFLAAPQE